MGDAMTIPAPDLPEALQGEGVLSLDNIRLDLPLAGPASRVLAAAIDYLVLGVLVLLWFLAWIVLAPNLSGGWIAAVLLIGLFLLEQGYFMGCEIALGGRTPGKMAMRLRVVGQDGGEAGTSALVLRNLLRSVDVIVGVVLMIFDRRSRRLGDRLGGTLVVHEPREERPSGLLRIPAGWGAREVAVVESFLARRSELEAARRDHLARRILGWIERDDPRLLEGGGLHDPQADPVAALIRALGTEEAVP